MPTASVNQNLTQAGRVCRRSSRNPRRLSDVKDKQQINTSAVGRKSWKIHRSQGQNQRVKESLQSREKSVVPKNRATDQVGTAKVQSHTKRKRASGDESQPIHISKRPRFQQNQSSPVHRRDFIDNWVNQSTETGSLPADQKQILDVLANMPRKHVAPLPSPRDSSRTGSTVTSTSKKSERSTASTRDPDYHQSLGFRNIFVERECPPRELMQQAQRLITRPRVSPEIDDETAERLTWTSRRLRNEAEDVIIKQLGSQLIPAMTEVPDPRLALNADQQWSNAVHLPLDGSILISPLPLPNPKPDLAFGYSETAFTRSQRGAVDLLINDEFGQSYAVPDSKLRFPFLTVEFKAQAKQGTHYVATNQAAGAGAVALNGRLELARRSFGLGSFNYNEPLVFSVTMDHEMARVNVHWIQAPAEEGSHSFHVERLSTHLLDDSNGIRALIRAVKNILDDGVDARLRSLCVALEAYRDTVVHNRQAASSQAHRTQTSSRRENHSAEDVNTVLPGTPALTQQQRRHTKSGRLTTKVIQGPQPGYSSLQQNDDENVGSVSGFHDQEATITGGRWQGQGQFRNTRSSTRPRLVEVSALRAECRGQQGRSFSLSGKRVFIPEEQWQRASRSGKAALTNSKHNVWSYDT